jgi:hypothetical protein
MKHARLLWTEEQRGWLKEHMAILDGYARMTSLVDKKKQYRHEIDMLQQVLVVARANSTSMSSEVWAWCWWAYWYSACWIMTRFSPSPEYAEQLEASMAFRLALLAKREAALDALKNAHTREQMIATVQGPYR